MSPQWPRTTSRLLRPSSDSFPRVQGAHLVSGGTSPQRMTVRQCLRREVTVHPVRPKTNLKRWTLSTAHPEMWNPYLFPLSWNYASGFIQCLSSPPERTVPDPHGEETQRIRTAQLIVPFTSARLHSTPHVIWIILADDLWFIDPHQSER